MSDVLHTNLGNIFYIYNILKKYSDINHILSVKEIIEYLKNDYNESIEPRTIRRNIRVLIEKLDVDISTYNENKKGYFLRTKEFELSEIEMLIGIIKYAKFLDKEFSNDIIEKLKSLLSKYELETIKNLEKLDIYTKNTKTINKEVLNNLEILSDVIMEKKQIRFDYWMYDIDKKMHKTSEKIVSPYAILCDNEFFYLIAIDINFKNFSYFRLDKIKNIKITNQNIYKTSTNLNKFIESSVYMYGGQKQQVELKCNNYIIDYVIEKFGDNVSINKIDDKYFKVILNVCTVGLEMWIMQYINYVEVLSPISLKDSIKAQLLKALEKYD